MTQSSYLSKLLGGNTVGKELDRLRSLIDEVGLEELFWMQNLDPVDAVVALYNCGEFDLERLMRSYEGIDEEMEEDEQTDDEF